MGFLQTREVLRAVKAVHEELSRTYARLAGEASRPRVQLLLQYMSGQEMQQAEGLARYEREASEKVLGGWYNYVPAKPACEIVELIDVASDAHAQEVVEAALKMDSCLRDWYLDLARMAPSEDVRSLFEGLAELKDQQGRRAVWSTLMSGRFNESETGLESP
jgi:hypothetical protein